MQREWLENGRLRIWLTAAETEKTGICFSGDPASLESNLTAVKLAVGHLLCEVIKDRPRLLACSWEIEAMPIESGCLLLCTPRRLRARRPKSPGDHLFVLHLCTVEELFLLASGLRRCKPPLQAEHSALFLLGTEYRLIIQTKSDELPPLLYEYTSRCEKGDAAAAFTREHGKPLVAFDALQTIAARL